MADAVSAPRTAADFGWSGTEHYPDFWALLRDPETPVPFGKVVAARRQSVVHPLPERRAEALLLEGALRDQFVRHHGQIQSAYFCSEITGGAALTELRPPGRAGATRTLHTVLNSPVAALVQLEADCGGLAEQAGAAFTAPAEVTQLRACTDLAYAAVSRVMFTADLWARATSTESERIAAAAGAVTEYEAARRRIGAVIQRQARFVYFEGALLGAAATLLACALLGLVAAHNWTAVLNTPALVAAGVFGVLGAVTSVVQRMSNGSLLLDFSARRGQLLQLGALRPVIGAVLGIVVQFALVSGFVAAGPRDGAGTAAFAFFALVGFTAGFSERFATDMLERAGKIVSGPADPAPAAPPGSTVRTAADAPAGTAEDGHQQA